MIDLEEMMEKAKDIARQEIEHEQKQAKTLAQEAKQPIINEIKALEAKKEALKGNSHNRAAAERIELAHKIHKLQMQL